MCTTPVEEPWNFSGVEPSHLIDLEFFRVQIFRGIYQKNQTGIPQGLTVEAGIPEGAILLRLEFPKESP